MMRLIDANINRASEGVRVLEDVARFYLNREELSSKARELRHKIRKTLPFSDSELLSSRNSEEDTGFDISQNSNLDNKTDLKALISANFKRAQEAVRVIEESLKTEGFNRESKIYESIRFELYTLEKQYFPGENETFSLPDIYGLTYHECSLGRSNVEIVREMIKAGIKLIQYREKEASQKEKYQECLEIRKLTKEAGVTFIVNDDIDIARLVDADGVHIGQDDLPVAKVRELLGPGKIIGLSTHSPEQGKKAMKEGVDYIGVGPIYATKTKKNVCDPVGHKYLEWAGREVSIPFVAIGGIKEHNLHEIMQRGASSVALVSEITGNENIPAKVKALRKVMKENR